MKNSGINGFWRNCLGAFMAALTVYACANKGYPEGGPKDETPPVVVRELPVSRTTNFDKKKIDIYFNEFVQLKEVGEKFVFSPPLKKTPKVRLKGKYVQVQIEDTLRPNTTYSMDFADAIADNNEGNPLGYYRYVFSTGSVIDSLELSGRVVEAETGDPVLNALVTLYEDHSDSIPLLSLPSYVARTDSSGNFRVTNLAGVRFRVGVIADDNKDNKYTPEAERFGFMDTTVLPIVMPMVRTDSFKVVERISGQDTVFRDSTVTATYLGYGPVNLYLRMFKEDPTQLYLMGGKRNERERIDFTFSIPGENRFEARLWDTLAVDRLPEDWYALEQNPGRDSIALWITDSTVYRKDTLNLILSYLRTDSTGVRNLSQDTVRYTFKAKKADSKKKKSSDKKKENGPKFLEIKTNVSSSMDLGTRLSLEFDRPVKKEELQGLRLTMKQDSLDVPCEYTLDKDSASLRRIFVAAAWEEGKEYKLGLDSAACSDIYGRRNNVLDLKFTVKKREDYGKLMLDMHHVRGQVIVQLLKAGGPAKSEKGGGSYTVLREMKTDRNGKLLFDLLPEGKYNLRAIFDTDRNGKWTTGLYLKHRQPEQIVYLPVEITVRQNFDIEQSFDLDTAAERLEPKKEEKS